MLDRAANQTKPTRYVNLYPYHDLGPDRTNMFCVDSTSAIL